MHLQTGDFGPGQSSEVGDRPDRPRERTAPGILASPGRIRDTLGMARPSRPNSSDRACRILPVLALALLPLAGVTQAPPTDEPSPPPAATDEPTPDRSETGTEAAPRRVHIWVDRYEEVSGEILEDGELLLSIRTPEGEIRTFTKSRLIRVIPLVDVSEPRPGIVELRDGSILAGQLLEDSFDSVTLVIEGVRTTLPRETVVQTRLDLTVEEKYERFKANIEPDQYLRRYELAEWLVDEESLELARTELIEIIAEIQMPEAITLLRTVDAQIALEAGTLPDNRGSERPPSGRDTGTVDLRDMLPQQILSADDVNLVRVYEIDFRSPPARVNIEPQLVREVLEKYGASPLIPADSAGRTRLFRAEPLEFVDLMFRLKAREFYPRIQVASEPPALNLFRQRVHDAWLIPNCATSRCHGGLDGGRFFLHRRGSRSERVRYTNLLILERWNELDQPLIDWQDPGRSLIIQYGLPRQEARFPHPDVKGWRPIFTPGNHRVLRDSLRWIESMYQPRPGYPVEYTAPVIEVPELPDPGLDAESPVDGRRDR